MTTKYHFRIALLSFLAVVALMGVFFIRYYVHSFADPLLYFITLFITFFELSRITASLLYEHKWMKTDDYFPTVSFVVPAMNEGEAIVKTLEKCFDVDYPQEKIEVFAINDGSTDNTWDRILEVKARHPALRAINLRKNQGKRIAMATAIKRAKGEIIVQIDSDSYLEKEALRELTTPFRDRTIGAVCAHTDPENTDTNLLTKMQHAYYFMSFRTLKAAESYFEFVFCCSGCCSAYRRDIITPILDKWTNETFLGRRASWGDDRALTNFVLKAGYQTIYAEDVQAYTNVPVTLKQFIKQQIRWKKGWFVNSLKVLPIIIKQDLFVAVTYFIPLILITLLTPFLAFKALVLNPIFFHISPIFYLLGVLFISSLFSINYYLYRQDGYWKYTFLWTVLNMTFLSYIMVYALFDLKNTKWGTR